jgi:hypothetical protein
MKPAVGVVAALIVALIGLVALSNSWRRHTQSEEARLERVERKRQFLERSAVARQFGADRAKDWLAEEQALARWYFDELASIQARHPEDRRAPATVEEKDPKRRAELQEWQKYVGERLIMLREGKYQPRWSSADQGLHLDLLAVNAGKSPASGEPGLQIDFALWGAPRRVDREPVPGTSRTATRVTVPLAFRQLSFQILDAQGKPHAEMVGSGEPYQKVVDPERFEEDFPPGVLFGTWWIERFPREAARAVFQLSVEARGISGVSLPANYRIELPVEESWKIGPGESYQAETRFAPSP